MKFRTTEIGDSLLAICVALILIYVLDPFWLTGIGFLLTARAFLKLLRVYELHFPVIEMIIALAYIQLVLAPGLYYSLDLSWAGSEKFSMAISEREYMLFSVPSILLIQIVLSGLSKKISDTQRFVVRKIQNSRTTYQTLGISLFCIGVASLLILPWVRPELRFIFYLLSLFPYVGFTFMWISKFTYREVVLLIVSLYTFATAILSSIFFNAIIWMFFIISFVLYGRRFPMAMKIMLLVGGIYLMFVVQVAKHDYRNDVWSGGSEEGISLFVEKAYQALRRNDFAQLSGLSVLNRLNQGYILAQVISYTNKTGRKSDQLLREINGILIPRFINKNKISVNTGTKLTYLTGWRVVGGYTMSVGVQGDAYASFGYWGGLLFIFVFFFFIRRLILYLLVQSSVLPSLFIWMPFILFYIVRPGAEFYIIGNWILRAIIVIYTVMLLFNSSFRRLI